MGACMPSFRSRVPPPGFHSCGLLLRGVAAAPGHIPTPSSLAHQAMAERSAANQTCRYNRHGQPLILFRSFSCPLIVSFHCRLFAFGFSSFSVFIGVLTYITTTRKPRACAFTTGITDSCYRLLASPVSAVTTAANLAPAAGRQDKAGVHAGLFVNSGPSPLCAPPSLFPFPTGLCPSLLPFLSPCLFVHKQCPSCPDLSALHPKPTNEGSKIKYFFLAFKNTRMAN